MARKTATDATGLGCFLVLMLLIGGFIYILLPLFFNEVKFNYHRKSEGQTYVNAMNRAQQAYHLTEQRFSDNIPDLGLGIQTETESYTYSNQVTGKAVFNYGISRHDQVPSYVGGVFVVPATNVNSDAALDDMTTVAILCEADTTGSIKPTAPTYQNGKLACGEGTTDLSR